MFLERFDLSKRLHVREVLQNLQNALPANRHRRPVSNDVRINWIIQSVFVSNDVRTLQSVFVRLVEFSFHSKWLSQNKIKLVASLIKKNWTVF